MTADPAARASSARRLNDGVAQPPIKKISGIFNPNDDIKEQFDKLEAKYINFNTGKLLKGTELNDFLEEHKGDYDQIAATRKPEYSTSLDASQDIAIIKNRENVGKFFVLRDENNLIDKVILPVRGYGLWGTLFGYISIENDFNTVAGLEFYDHKETPGLGAEVDNPKWKALWIGKEIYDGNGDIGVYVKKGQANNDIESEKSFAVDGLSGATLTSRGVDNLVRFWMGDNAFAPFIKHLKAGEA